MKNLIHYEWYHKNAALVKSIGSTEFHSYIHIFFEGGDGQGTRRTKIGVNKLSENTPNVPNFISQNCLPKPKIFGFLWKKASLGVRSLCIVWLSDLTLSSGISISTFHYVYLALCISSFPFSLA